MPRSLGDMRKFMQSTSGHVLSGTLDCDFSIKAGTPISAWPLPLVVLLCEGALAYCWSSKTMLITPHTGQPNELRPQNRSVHYINAQPG